MTKKLKKDLQTVNKELNALVKKTESLLKTFDKLEKPKAKPAKTKAVKKSPVKKAAVKKPAPKKAPATAVDTVLAIIKRYKKGVNTETLVKKTGYNQKKISNLVFKLRKQDKIKSPEKGIYIKA
jgi:predicted Rossmann fold nucleotide-binding protein DprA/Smf involved in DNA uptake